MLRLLVAVLISAGVCLNDWDYEYIQDQDIETSGTTGNDYMVEPNFNQNNPSSDNEEIKPSANNTKRKPDLLDYLSGKMLPRKVKGEWISDSEFLMDFTIHDFKTGKSVDVLSGLSLNPEEIQLSSDRSYAIAKMESKEIWRYSTLGKFTLINFKKSDSPITPLTNNNTWIKFVKWAPSSNALVYIDGNNNINYRHKPEGKTSQITNKGRKDTVFCGIADWVYEEEVLETEEAVWWSPDSTKLAYAIFNDSQVMEYKYPYYGPWQSVLHMKNLYPRQIPARYPKAGTRNPDVELHVIELNGPELGKRVMIHPPPAIGEEALLTRVKWMNKDSIIVNWMNRIQNFTVTMVCQIAEGSAHCDNVYKRKARNGWIEIGMEFTPIPDGTGYIFKAPDKTKAQHIQIYKVWRGTVEQVSKNEGDVTKILKYCQNGDIYYLGVQRWDRKCRHLFRIRDDVTTCLTCHLTKRHCDFADAIMSTNGTTAVVNCLGRGIPFTILMNTETNEVVKVLENNQDLRAFVSVPLSHSVYLPVGKSNVELILPAGVTFDSAVKLPAFLYVYGGPGDQQVDKQWADPTLIVKYMVENKGYIGIKMDVSGSGFRGEAYMHSVYRNIGIKESRAIIRVIKTLIKKFSIIDERKVGIYGWSYGGFMSLSVLASDVYNVFACGASVAPVSMWNLYDSIYTERFMSTPEDNPEGYNSSTPLWKLGNLRNKQFLVLHGTADDNVHFQQSMLIAGELERQGILFQQNVYPNENHSIPNYIEHLFRTLSNFFDQCFN